MNATLIEFQSNFNSNIDLIKNEYNKLIFQINELEEKNNVLKQENTILTNVVEELNKEKKAKSSSTIWESMNSKLAEKDIIIEQLKKDVDFYKRTGPKTNIVNKWQSSVSKSNSSDFEKQKTNIETVKNVEAVEAVEAIEAVKDVETVKNVEAIEVIEVKKDIETIQTIEKDEKDDNDEEKEVKIKKSKDKSKDKSEKKKKKKKVVEEE